MIQRVPPAFAGMTAREESFPWIIMIFIQLCKSDIILEQKIIIIASSAGAELF
jgi:hypothetical protein